MAIITESDVTKARIDEVALKNYSLANHFCRTKEGVTGGGGGGILVLIHDSVP